MENKMKYNNCLKHFVIYGLILIIVILLAFIIFDNTSGTYELITITGGETSKGGYILLNTKTGSLWNYEWSLNKFIKIK